MNTETKKPIIFRELPKVIISGICEIRQLAGDIMHGRNGYFDGPEWDEARALAGDLHCSRYYEWVDGGNLTERVLLAIELIGALTDTSSHAKAASSWAKSLLES